MASNHLNKMIWSTVESTAPHKKTRGYFSSRTWTLPPETYWFQESWNKRISRKYHMLFLMYTRPGVYIPINATDGLGLEPQRPGATATPLHLLDPPPPHSSLPPPPPPLITLLTSSTSLPRDLKGLWGRAMLQFLSLVMGKWGSLAGNSARVAWTGGSDQSWGWGKHLLVIHQRASTKTQRNGYASSRQADGPPPTHLPRSLSPNLGISLTSFRRKIKISLYVMMRDAVLAPG